MVNGKNLGRIISMLLVVAMMMTSVPVNTMAADVADSIAIQDADTVGDETVAEVSATEEGDESSAEKENESTDTQEATIPEATDSDNSDTKEEDTIIDATIDDAKETENITEDVESLVEEDTLAEDTENVIINDELEVQDDEESNGSMESPISLEIGKDYTINANETYYFQTDFEQCGYTFNFTLNNDSQRERLFQATIYDNTKNPIKDYIFENDSVFFDKIEEKAIIKIKSGYDGTLRITKRESLTLTDVVLDEYCKSIYPKSNGDNHSWFNNYWDDSSFNFYGRVSLVFSDEKGNTIRENNHTIYDSVFSHYVSRFGIVVTDASNQEQILSSYGNDKSLCLTKGGYRLGYTCFNDNEIHILKDKNGNDATVTLVSFDDIKNNAETLSNDSSLTIERNYLSCEPNDFLIEGEPKFVKVNCPENTTTEFTLKHMKSDGRYSTSFRVRALDAKGNTITGDSSEEIKVNVDAGTISITPSEGNGGEWYLGINVDYDAELSYSSGKKIIKAEIASQPTKRQYTEGEWPWIHGMTIKLTYDDKTTSTMSALRARNWSQYDYSDEEYELGYNKVDIYLCRQGEDSPCFANLPDAGTYYFGVFIDEIGTTPAAKSAPINLEQIKASGELKVDGTLRHTTPVYDKANESYIYKYYAMNLVAGTKYKFETTCDINVYGDIFSIVNYKGQDVNAYFFNDGKKPFAGCRFTPKETGIYYIKTNLPYDYDISLKVADKSIKSFELVNSNGIDWAFYERCDQNYSAMIDCVPVGLKLRATYDNGTETELMLRDMYDRNSEWYQEGFGLELYDKDKKLIARNGSYYVNTSSKVTEKTTLWWKIVNYAMSEDSEDEGKWIEFTLYPTPELNLGETETKSININKNLFVHEGDDYYGRSTEVPINGVEAGKTYAIKITANNKDSEDSDSNDDELISFQRVYSCVKENGRYSNYDFSGMSTRDGIVIFSPKDDKRQYVLQLSVWAKTGVNVTIEELKTEDLPREEDVKINIGGNIIDNKSKEFGLILLDYAVDKFDDSNITATVNKDEINLSNAATYTYILDSNMKAAKYDTLNHLSPGNYYKQYSVPHESKFYNTKTRKWEASNYIQVYVPFSVKGISSDYKIKFDANGGTGKMNILSAKKNVCTKLTSNKFKRTGYSFVGWSRGAYGPIGPDDEVPEDLYKNNETVINLSDDGEPKTLYAVWQIAKYDINVRWNGVTAKSDIIPAIQADFTIETDDIPLPTKDGLTTPEDFDFTGWYFDSQYKSKVPENENGIQIIKKGTASNVNLYAKLEPKKYTIVFDKNDGGIEGVKGTMSNLSVSYGVDTALTANKYSSGKAAFMGWALTRDAEEVLYPNKSVITIEDIISNGGKPDNGTNTVTLYAVWKSEFNITADTMYEENGTKAPLPDGFPSKYTYGTTVKLPAPLSRTGYTFGGWYSDENFKTKVTKITSKMSGDINLYAKWTPIRFKVKFDGNGGYIINKKNTAANINVNYDSQAKIPESYMNVYARNGYTFMGYTTSDNKNKVKELDEKHTVDSLEDEGIKIFTGGDEVQTLSEANNSTVSLYAVWKKCPYTITFDTVIPDDIQIVDSNGNPFNETMKYNYKDDISLPVLKLKSVDPSMTFDGWYTENYKTKITTTKKLAGNITLYAKWKKRFEVEFYANKPAGTDASGTMKNLEMWQGTEKALSDNKFKVPGYAFMGWAETPNYQYGSNEGRLIKNKEKYLVKYTDKDTIKLYAVWSNQFNINYNLNGGIGSYADDTYRYGYEKQLMIPVKSGYTFSGWYTDDGTFKKKVSKITKNMSGNMDLYAKWTPNKYKVTFVANAPEGRKVTGRMSPQTLTYKVQKKLTRNGYKISGYKFKGWTTVQYKEGAVIPEGTLLTDMATVGNIGNGYYETKTLYANWEKIDYTIICNLNGVAANVAGLAADGSIEYKAEGKDYSYSPVVKTGGKYKELKTYTIDETVIINNIVEPYRPGYTFVGWYTDAKCRRKATDIAVGKATNLTLYAKWIVK